MKITLSLPLALVELLGEPTVPGTRLLAPEKRQQALTTAAWLRDALQLALDQGDPRLQQPVAELAAELHQRKLTAYADAATDGPTQGSAEAAEAARREAALLNRLVSWLTPDDDQPEPDETGMLDGGQHPEGRLYT